jgi:transposase-like protein
MTLIEKGELELDDFVSEVAAMVGDIVKAPFIVPEISGLARRKKCLTEGCNGYLRHITKAKGTSGSRSFFACSVCGRTFSDLNGEPVAKRQSEGDERVEADCPCGCGKKARRLKGQYGFFWKCDCSPDQTFRDIDGKPALREERPKAKCPVKGCKGVAAQFKTKNDGRLFWKCSTCGNTFDDSDGKPVIREKKGRSEAKSGKFEATKA